MKAVFVILLIGISAFILLYLVFAAFLNLETADMIAEREEETKNNKFFPYKVDEDEF